MSCQNDQFVHGVDYLLFTAVIWSLKAAMAFCWRNIKENRLLSVIFCLLICAIVGPLVTLHQLNKSTLPKDFSVQFFTSRNTLDKNDKDEFLVEQIDELKLQINELEKIKLSLSNELRDLEGKRHVIHKNIQKLHETAEKLKQDFKKVTSLVYKAKRDLDIFKLEKTKINQCPQLPYMKLPNPPDLKPLEESLVKNQNKANLRCTLESCFDFSRCPYSAGFSIYVYNPLKYLTKPSKITNSAYNILKSTLYFTTDGTKACVYIVLLRRGTTTKLEPAITSLPYWNNGRNHIIMHLKTDDDHTNSDLNTGMAMLAQSSFTHSQFRPGFDLLMPPLVGNYTGVELWKHTQQQLPAYRRYFLSFEGHTADEEHVVLNSKDLLLLSKESNDFYIKTYCNITKSRGKQDWGLCGSHFDRIKLLKQSTFSLVVGVKSSQGLLDSTHVRLIEALQSGAIPVILGHTSLLPFSEFIDWRLAAVILPPARVTEVNTLLRTIITQDLLQLRRQGRFLWENYFSTQKSILYTTLAAVRTRLSLPAKPLLPSPSPSVFTETNQPVKNPPDAEAILELPITSPTFTRNITTTVNYVQSDWNNAPGAIYSFPSTPFEPMFPSSAPFLNTTTNFELINNGKGGSGEAFGRAQGGNHPKEQFTVVFLTYERELVLMESIQRLVGLQYLNKVIVVWNSPANPSISLRWPDIGVPVHVSNSN